METIRGRFVVGLWDEESKTFQRDFEMRLPTLEDTENALEETPDGASMARIRRHEWAACLLSVGCIPAEKITPERLAGLASVEYGILSDAQEKLLKKLSGEKSDSPMSD